VKQEPSSTGAEAVNWSGQDPQRKMAEQAAQALGREFIIVGGGTESEIDAAFATLVQRGASISRHCLAINNKC